MKGTLELILFGAVTLAVILVAMNAPAATVSFQNFNPTQFQSLATAPGYIGITNGASVTNLVNSGTFTLVGVGNLKSIGNTVGTYGNVAFGGPASGDAANTATGNPSFIGTGSGNVASGGDAQIVGGTDNTNATLSDSFMGGGGDNSLGIDAFDTDSALVAGSYNHGGGEEIFFGAGDHNSIQGNDNGELLSIRSTVDVNSTLGFIVAGESNTISNSTDVVTVWGFANSVSNLTHGEVSGMSNTVKNATNVVVQGFQITVSGKSNVVAQGFGSGATTIDGNNNFTAASVTATGTSTNAGETITGTLSATGNISQGGTNLIAPQVGAIAGQYWAGTVAGAGWSNFPERILFANNVTINGSGMTLGTAATNLSLVGQFFGIGQPSGINELYIADTTTITGLVLNWANPANTTNGIIMTCVSNSTAITAASMTNSAAVTGSSPYPPSAVLYELPTPLVMPPGSYLSINLASKGGTIATFYGNFELLGH